MKEQNCGGGEGRGTPEGSVGAVTMLGKGLEVGRQGPLGNHDSGIMQSKSIKGKCYDSYPK